MLEVVDPTRMGGSVAVGLFVGILVFLMVGRRIGRKALARHGSVGRAGIGSLEGAVFALMGLLIAFTFSGGLTRFDERRARAVRHRATANHAIELGHEPPPCRGGDSTAARSPRARRARAE